MNNFKRIGLGILKLLGLIILTLMMNITPMLFLMYSQNLPVYAEIFLVLAYLIIAFFVIRTLWRAYHGHLPEEQKKFRLSGADIGFAFLFAFAARVLAILGVYLNKLLSGNAITNNDAALQGVGKAMSVKHIFFALLFMVTLAFLTPIIEELVFRGMASVLFFKKQQKVLAAIITSVIFALPHVTLWTEFPVYFLIGVLLYLAYARRGSIKDSILVHCLHNLLPALLIFLSMAVGQN